MFKACLFSDLQTIMTMVLFLTYFNPRAPPLPHLKKAMSCTAKQRIWETFKEHYMWLLWRECRNFWHPHQSYLTVAEGNCDTLHFGFLLWAGISHSQKPVKKTQCIYIHTTPRRINSSHSAWRWYVLAICVSFSGWTGNVYNQSWHWTHQFWAGASNP